MKYENVSVLFLLFSLETDPGLQRQHYLSATQSKVILTKHLLSSGNLQVLSQVWIQPTSKSLDPHIRPMTYIGSMLYDGPPEIQICSLPSCPQMGHNFSGKCLPDFVLDINQTCLQQLPVLQVCSIGNKLLLQSHHVALSISPDRAVSRPRHHPRHPPSHLHLFLFTTLWSLEVGL